MSQCSACPPARGRWLATCRSPGRGVCSGYRRTWSELVERRSLRGQACNITESTHSLVGGAFFAAQLWIVAAYLVRRPALAVSQRTVTGCSPSAAPSAACCYALRGASALGGHRRDSVSKWWGWQFASCRSSRLAAPSASRRPTAASTSRVVRNRAPSHLRLLRHSAARLCAAEHLSSERHRDGLRVQLRRRSGAGRGASARHEHRLRRLPCGRAVEAEYAVSGNRCGQMWAIHVWVGSPTNSHVYSSLRLLRHGR